LDTERITQELRAERERLDRAITILQEAGSGTVKSNGRRRARHMSAEARRRISEAQKRRWVARRKTASTTPAATSQGTIPRKRRGISAAGRKRLSEMMKRRWAERRKKK
jgi:hypothetical protein